MTQLKPTQDSRWVAFLMLGALAYGPALRGAEVGAGAESLWSAHVEPLLKEHCVECHNATKSKSGLDLTSLQTILRGGERGAAVIPGRPDDSNLYTFLRTDADPHMPPGKRAKLADDEVTLIRQWIEKLGSSLVATSGTNSVEGHSVATPIQPRITWQPPADMNPPKAVDHYLGLAWKLDHVTPAALADDRTFARRIYLDLVGRIPTQGELERFTKARGRDKRSALVESLLESEEYPRRMREVFDPVLMERRGEKWEDRRANQKWFAWLEEAFRRNRPWNETVHDFIVARPTSTNERGAVWFLFERENNPQAVAEALAPVVFGVQVKCAQCHDHMIAREIKQAHYWGMVAAFNRSKNVDTPVGPGIAESAIGGFVSFANLKKESQQARLVFFNGRSVDDPWPKDGEKEKDSPELYRVPPPPGKEKPKEASVPKFSRREAFAEAVTRGNPLLARAMVNRMWALLFGRGLVHPVDLMDSKHPASQPELLDWLSRDFERNGYDVKRLIRTLCNSRAYQLGPPSTRTSLSKAIDAGKSAAKSEKEKSKSGRRPGTSNAPADSFSRPLDKPLSAEQLFRSLLIATESRPDTNGVIAGVSEQTLRRSFVRQFPDLFPAEYNATLQQAMFYSNSDLLDRLLAASKGNLTARLAAMTDEALQVREAFSVIFGRAPDKEEFRECSTYLHMRSPETGIPQLLWAMLTSAEFQLNH